MCRGLCRTMKEHHSSRTCNLSSIGACCIHEQRCPSITWVSRARWSVAVRSMVTSGRINRAVGSHRTSSARSRATPLWLTYVTSNAVKRTCAIGLGAHFSHWRVRARLAPKTVVPFIVVTLALARFPQSRLTAILAVENRLLIKYKVRHRVLVYIYTRN